jgi:hypothetical protein
LRASASASGICKVLGRHKRWAGRLTGIWFTIHTSVKPKPEGEEDSTDEMVTKSSRASRVSFIGGRPTGKRKNRVRLNLVTDTYLLTSGRRLFMFGQREDT